MWTQGAVHVQQPFTKALPVLAQSTRTPSFSSVGDLGSEEGTVGFERWEEWLEEARARQVSWGDRVRVRVRVRVWVWVWARARVGVCVGVWVEVGLGLGLGIGLGLR